LNEKQNVASTKTRGIHSTLLILKTTIPKKVTTSGRIAMFNERARCLFHNFDAESISDALRRTIKHITDATLTSATPIEVNVLIADVVLIDDVATADVALIMDDSM
jgi:hypothetical protein